MARPVGHPMGLLQAGGGACARWGGSVTSYAAYGTEHVRAGCPPIADPHRMPFLVRYFIDMELDGIISRASGCRHRINTSVFNVSSVPRIGARSIGASPKGRIRPSHSNIISMEAVMDPAGVPTVCFIRT